MEVFRQPPLGADERKPGRRRTVAAFPAERPGRALLRVPWAPGTGAALERLVPRAGAPFPGVKSAAAQHFAAKRRRPRPQEPLWKAATSLSATQLPPSLHPSLRHCKRGPKGGSSLRAATGHPPTLPLGNSRSLFPGCLKNKGYSVLYCTGFPSGGGDPSSSSSSPSRGRVSRRRLVGARGRGGSGHFPPPVNTVRLPRLFMELGAS